MVTCNSFIRTNTQTYVWTSPYRTTTTLGVGGRRQCVLFRVLIIMLNSCSAWKCRHHFIFRCIACSSHKNTHTRCHPDQTRPDDVERRRKKWIEDSNERWKRKEQRGCMCETFLLVHTVLLWAFSAQLQKCYHYQNSIKTQTCAYLYDMFGNLWICRGYFDKYENVFITTASLLPCSHLFSAWHQWFFASCF